MIEVCSSPYLMFVNGEIKEARLQPNRWPHLPYAASVKLRDSFQNQLHVQMLER